MLLYCASTESKYSDASLSMLKNRPRNLTHSARFSVPMHQLEHQCDNFCCRKRVSIVQDPCQQA